MNCAMCCGPGGPEAELVIVDSSSASAQPREAGEQDRGPLESPRNPPATTETDAYGSPPPPAQKAATMGDREQTMFSASVAKGSRPLGMDVNYHDNATLLVTRVNAGPCYDYNRASPDQLIAPGDRIVSVNGVSGETSQMVQACKAEELKMTIRRCDEKRVTLARQFPEQRFGMEVEQCDTVTLLIASVDEGDSVCAEYNRTSGGFLLEKDFRIIGVNDVYGDASKLEAELKLAQSWTIVVRQVWPK